VNRPYLPPERRNTLARSILRGVIAVGRGDDPIAFAESAWPGDNETLDILQQKAASTITSLQTSGVPTSTALATLLPVLGPASAFGGIIQLAAHADLDDYSALAIPQLNASGSGVAFTTEGAPFPMMQFSLAADTLSPKKAAFGVAFTRELWDYSGAETFMMPVLNANASVGLESILFDANASSTTRPAGLKNGIAATTADAGSGEAAMIADLANLGAICAAVGGANLAFIASPKQFIKIVLKRPAGFPFPVFCSSALPDRQVACIALPALAIAGYGEPKIQISKSALAVMQDSSPGQISAVGTPNAVAAPIFNPYQQDGVVLRVITDISWVLRDSAGFAWTQSTNW